MQHSSSLADPLLRIREGAVLLRGSLYVESSSQPNSHHREQALCVRFLPTGFGLVIGLRKLAMLVAALA